MTEPTPLSCPHCRTPVEANALAAPYCCLGCRAAHQLLTERGLDRFYALGTGVANPGGDEAAAPLAWLEPLVERARLTGREGRLHLTLDVQGIHCAACVWLIQTLFSRAPGALRADVNPGVGRATLAFEDGVFDLAAFATDLARVGYRLGPPLKASGAPSDGLGVRLGVSFALMMNVMMLTFASYFGLDPAEEPGLAALFGWASAGLTTIAVLVGGPVFFRAAWGALRRRALHLDVPIALGILLSWAGSLWLFATHGAEAAYFDTTTAFITLMLLGRFLQQRYVERSRRILLADSGLEGLRVRTVDPSGELALTPVTEVLCGTRLLVAPGELVPVEATLEGDAADFGLAWISGESDPVAFAPGGLVPAGAHLLGGEARRLVAAQGFGDSAVHDLLAPRSGAEATAADPFWHRLSTVYVVLVLLAAAVALLAWWGTSPERAVQVAIAVLVVTCPCAIGLATPLAYELVHARLRASGFFVRRLDLLDRLRRVRKVFFDKTGTVTLGALELKGGATAFDGLDAAAKAALTDMVARSNHPKSRAILRALEAAGAACHLRADRLVREQPGVGLSLEDGGARWLLVADPDAEADAAERALVLSRDGEVLTRFLFTETLRRDVRAEVERLSAAGVEVWLVSGDAPARVREAAASLGIAPARALAGLSPADKAALITAEDQGGDTLMIGDGLNDAPAFAAAACAGTPAIDRPTLPERADFFLMTSGVGPVSEALALSKRLRTTIVRNLGVAVVYNTLGVSLALAGLLSPVACAVLMPLSSLFTIALTLLQLGRRAPAPSAGRALPMPLARVRP